MARVSESWVKLEVLRLERAVQLASGDLFQNLGFESDLESSFINASTHNLLAEAMITELGVCRLGGRLRNGAGCLIKGEKW